MLSKSENDAQKLYEGNYLADTWAHHLYRSSSFISWISMRFVVHEFDSWAEQSIEFLYISMDIVVEWPTRYTNFPLVKEMTSQRYS